MFVLFLFQLNLFWFQKKIFYSNFGSFEKSVTFGPSQQQANQKQPSIPCFCVGPGAKRIFGLACIEKKFVS